LKKLLVMMFTVMLTLSLALPTAFAEVQTTEDENYQKVQAKVDKANEKIQELISEAIADGEEVMEEYNEGDLEEAKKNNAIEKIIVKLIDKTNKISERTRNYAAEKGYHVECFYEKVTIGDRTVDVDPLRVIGKY
jgi:DNA-directed RNA polymerase beta' subunit